MSIRIRGTADADDIAAVLAVLQRVAAPTVAPISGTAAWRARRRAALARTARMPRR